MNEEFRDIKASVAKIERLVSQPGLLPEAVNEMRIAELSDFLVRITDTLDQVQAEAEKIGWAVRSMEDE